MLYPIGLDALAPDPIDMFFYSPIPILIGILAAAIALFFIIRALKKRKK